MNNFSILLMDLIAVAFGVVMGDLPCVLPQAGVGILNKDKLAY